MGRNSFNAAAHSGAVLTRQRNAAKAAKWNGGRQPANPYAKRTPPVTVVVDEDARAVLLKDAAKSAKLKDMDLLGLAKRGLSPADAIADLKARYPQGFEVEPVKRYADMTAEEQAAFRRKHGLPQGNHR